MMHIISFFIFVSHRQLPGQFVDVDASIDLIYRSYSKHNKFVDRARMFSQKCLDECVEMMKDDF